jgi:ferredoxin
MASRLLARAAFAACAGALLCAAATQDVFDFIPQGGRTLLASALANRAPPDEARAIVGAKRTRDEWAAYLREHRKAIPGMQKLGDGEIATLSDYLASNMPLAAAKVPANPAQANWAKILPADGRDYALDYCQSCHIITVVITQDRTREAWMGTLNKPSHVGIKLSREQREALVSFLVLNAAIPIDRVPEDLRAGGATY